MLNGIARSLSMSVDSACLGAGFGRASVRVAAWMDAGTTPLCPARTRRGTTFRTVDHVRLKGPILLTTPIISRNKTFRREAVRQGRGHLP